MSCASSRQGPARLARRFPFAEGKPQGPAHGRPWLLNHQPALVNDRLSATDPDPSLPPSTATPQPRSRRRRSARHWPAAAVHPPCFPFPSPSGETILEARNDTQRTAVAAPMRCAPDTHNHTGQPATVCGQPAPDHAQKRPGEPPEPGRAAAVHPDPETGLGGQMVGKRDIGGVQLRARSWWSPLFGTVDILGATGLGWKPLPKLPDRFGCTGCPRGQSWLKAASKEVHDVGKSNFLRLARASGAPWRRSMPASSHSMLIGPV